MRAVPGVESGFRMQQWDWFMGIKARRLSSRFVIGSLLFHAAMVGLFLLHLPSHPVTPAVSPPLMVTILDPAAVSELPIGPATHLPPKPQNLVPRPRGPKATAPALERPGDTSMAKQPVESASAPRSMRGFPSMEQATPPVLSPSGKRPGAVAPPPSGGGPSPGLPFVSREEIDRLAKLFTEQPSPSKEPYTVNTEDLQYLSYIAQIARILELIWKYPKEAGDRGQQGETVLKVTILEDGTLQVAQLLQTSGHPLLDEEAMRAVKRVAPYPPLPKSWHRSEWDLTISFTYYIQHVAVGVI
jgi:TonB family protein